MEEIRRIKKPLVIRYGPRHKVDEVRASRIDLRRRGPALAPNKKDPEIAIQADASD